MNLEKYDYPAEELIIKAINEGHNTLRKIVRLDIRSENKISSYARNMVRSGDLKSELINNNMHYEITDKGREKYGL